MSPLLSKPRVDMTQSECLALLSRVQEAGRVIGNGQVRMVLSGQLAASSIRRAISHRHAPILYKH